MNYLLSLSLSQNLSFLLFKVGMNIRTQQKGHSQWEMVHREMEAI